MAGDLLTPEFAVQVGRAAAVVLAQKAGPHPLFVIGRDTRLSGPMLEAALTAGLTSGGARVEIAGVIPTPGLASLVHQRGANAGVVISASHNPFADNGIKFFSDAGTKLSDEEEAEIEAHIQHHDLQSLAGADFGSAEQLEGAVEGYVWDVVKRIPLDLSGMKIALDCAHGAMHLAAPLALEESGAHVTVLFDQPDGTNINAGCGSTHMAALQKAVADDGFDLGLAFDGDGDRVLAVDAAGNLVDGDFIIAILAKHLKAQGKLRAETVVTTVMTNLGFHLAMEREGIDVIVTAVGDRYVVAEMLKGDYLLGGEQSGHIINRDVSTTGDGLATSLLLLQALRQMDVPLAEAATRDGAAATEAGQRARARPDRAGRGRGGVGGGRRGDPPPRRKRPHPRASLGHGAAGARDGGGAHAGRRRRRLRAHRRRRRGTSGLTEGIVVSDEVKYYPFKIGGVEQIHPNVHPGTPKYAAGIVVGNIAFLSGMTPQSTEDGSCLTVGVEAQVFACLDKVRAVLEEMGSSMENIVKTVILLKDLEYYQQMRAAELKYYQEYAPRLVSEPPASTYVQPAILARPEFLVEFDVTAVVKRA